MAKRDPRVGKYIEGRAPFARPILKHLRKALGAASPAMEETIKWGMPTFVYKGKIVCGFAGFKAHCALWFREGKAIVGKRPAGAMGNFGRITAAEELPSAAKIRSYVSKALRRIDERSGTA